MGKAQDTAVATQGPQAVVSAEVLALFNLKDQMEGVEPRLPQIEIIHKGQMWKFPDESKKECFEAVILDHNRANAWWEKSVDESGGNAAPDCFSLDGLTPDPRSPKKQCENCMVCPRNAFGSDERGRGKACKNTKRVHILLDDTDLPHRLTLSPSSLKKFDKYITSLTGKRLPMQMVRTEFSLKEEKNSDGFTYSEVVLTPVMEDGHPVIVGNTPEAASQMVEMVTQWKDAMRGQTFHAEELSSSQPEPYNPVHTGPAEPAYAGPSDYGTAPEYAGPADEEWS